MSTAPLSTANLPVVHLPAGLTGSGKTTYARRLEAEGVLRLSVDEEVFARHGRYGVDYPEHEYPEREEYKKLVEDASGTWRLIHLKVDKAELLRRLAERNQRSATDANALTVTPEMLDDFFARFEEPSGEGEEIIPRTTEAGPRG